MVIIGKIIQVGSFTPAGEFEAEGGRKFAFPARRQLMLQQVQGDICICRVEASEATAYKVGTEITVRVDGYKNLGGIAQIKGVVA